MTELGLSLAPGRGGQLVSRTLASVPTCDPPEAIKGAESPSNPNSGSARPVSFFSGRFGSGATDQIACSSGTAGTDFLVDDRHGANVRPPRGRNGAGRAALSWVALPQQGAGRGTPVARLLHASAGRRAGGRGVAWLGLALRSEVAAAIMCACADAAPIITPPLPIPPLSPPPSTPLLTILIHDTLYRPDVRHAMAVQTSKRVFCQLMGSILSEYNSEDDAARECSRPSVHGPCTPTPLRIKCSKFEIRNSTKPYNVHRSTIGSHHDEFAHPNHTSPNGAQLHHRHHRRHHHRHVCHDPILRSQLDHHPSFSGANGVDRRECMPTHVSLVLELA